MPLVDPIGYSVKGFAKVDVPKNIAPVTTYSPGYMAGIGLYGASVTPYVAPENKNTGGGGAAAAPAPGFSLYDVRLARAQALWDKLGCIGDIPYASLINWMDRGYLDSEDGILVLTGYIKQTDNYWNGAVAGTERLLWQDDYETRIGHDITDAALSMLEGRYRAGYSREQWNFQIEEFAEYRTGVEMMGRRFTYLDVLYDMWGIGQVDDAVAGYLAANPGQDYIIDFLMPQLGVGASAGVIADWARREPQYLTGPQASATRENLYNAYASIMRTAPDPDWLNDKVLDGWTPDQMVQYLRTTAEYKRIYAAKPLYMSEAEFNSLRDGFNAVGRWYYRQAGTLQTLTEAEVQALRDTLGLPPEALPPGVHLNEAGEYVTWDGAWEMTDAQLASMLDVGWTPAEWEQHLRYTEQAIANLDTMNYLGEALGLTFTQEDALAVQSGAEGSGRIKALLTQAEHRRSFDTSFALLNGRMPTLADYEMLEADYVSAEHYYQAMTAVQQAEAQFPAIDRMFWRIYGHGADLQKLIDVNLDRPGSGPYEAMVQAAEELDRYTGAYREWARHDPTPEDYARFAGMSGPAELEKEIMVLENMKAKGPRIRQRYDEYWGKQGVAPLSDDELETLLGEYQGWGSIQARLDMADERRKLREQSVEMSLRWGAAIAPIAFTEFGGTKLPGLRRIGG